jgi:hypothetical protein
MENIKLYKKAIFGVILMLGAVMSNGISNNAMAQTDNQSQEFPNNTETVEDLGNFNGI